MSDLLYTPLAHADHAWLNAPDRALQITGGQHDGKVIKLTITKNQIDTDQDGTIDAFVVVVQGCLVDIATGDVVQVNGSDVCAPGSPATVQADAVANGDIDLQVWISERLDETVHKVLRLEMSMTAWASAFGN
ncbi:MAG: hypothetical protein Alis3KO_01080 [Aliiglaciecola sp.]